MSITQFANSIRSSETTVQLLKDELRKEHETAANYLKEIEESVYRELDNVERFLQAGMDENMDPNKEVLKPRIDFYGADIDRAIIRVSPNDYVRVDLSPVVTNIRIDLKEKIDLAKPDGDIMHAMNAIAVLKAAIVDTLKERNERRLVISVDSDADSFSVYIDADGEEGNPKDVHRQLAEYIGERPSFGMGSMIVNMLESM
ncbi:hypothetical protein ACMG5L_22215 [Escherichia coli]|uniref:hypothetical protein n=1 Tax=Escherichia coli TaxID=562 RepID=UPI0039BFE360